LLGLALLDELASGIASVAAPDIERVLSTSHATLTLALFVVPGIIGLVLEPLIFLRADRHRPAFIRAGLIAMSLASIGAAFAPGLITLSLAIALLYLGIGAASGLAQAMLVDADPSSRGRTMARWTLLAVAGDLLAPALLVVVDWHLAFAVVASLCALAALGTVSIVSTGDSGRSAMDSASLSGESTGDGVNSVKRERLTQLTPSPVERLREAIRDRRLVLWLFATALCDLLDEILVVFASLHVRDDLHGTVLVQQITIGAFVAGSAIGLVVLERLLKRWSERTLLIAAALACAAAYAAWLATPSIAAGIALMPFVGATAAPLYPLAAAQAYACRPDASGAVLAASHLFTPLGLGLPFLVGLLADHAGTTVALAALLVQPLGLALLAATSRSPKPT
jgi:MFS family permease